jgi:transposase
MSKKHHNYTSHEKAKIALEALKGNMTQAEISYKYKVHTTQIYKWKKLLESNIANIFKDSTTTKEKNDSELINNLYTKIGQLNIELDWLKKKSKLFSRN